MANNFSFYVFWVVSKIQRMIFSLIWHSFLLAYFAIGVGALGVIFLIEAQFFTQLTQYPIAGYGIAAIFEVAKVGTSMMKQTLFIANRVIRVKVSGLVHSLTTLFQVALIVVSIVCSVVVVTWYLEGYVVVKEGRLVQTSRRASAPQPVVASTLEILENGLHVSIDPDTFHSVFAVLLSVLLQATSYIVFGHLIAVQSKEIEHLFEVKMSSAAAKKNCGTPT